jgi:hypothetical protein
MPQDPPFALRVVYPAAGSHLTVRVIPYDYRDIKSCYFEKISTGSIFLQL